MSTSERLEPANRRHRVVIIGGGFAGLQAVRSLSRAPVDQRDVDIRVRQGAGDVETAETAPHDHHTVLPGHRPTPSVHTGAGP